MAADGRNDGQGQVGEALSHEDAVAELRQMFAARVRQPGDLDADDVRHATGLASRDGVRHYMRALVAEQRYIELPEVYDRETGRIKTVWRRVMPEVQAVEQAGVARGRSGRR